MVYMIKTLPIILLIMIIGDNWCMVENFLLLDAKELENRLYIIG